MSYILNIDTAVESASVCLAEDDQPLLIETNPNSRESAAWLHVAIEKILQEKTIQITDLDAVAVSSGPGSYTGLRVGMAAAKGLCYALGVPLITVNTLKMMAASVQNEEAEMLCPMIDARRMEVFAGVFDRDLNEVWPSMNLVLDSESFRELINHSTILFFGNGSNKFKEYHNHPNMRFRAIHSSAQDMVKLSFQKYTIGDLASLAYSEPFYGKDFHSIIPNS